MDAAHSPFDFSKLSTSERILLAQALWESVQKEARTIPLDPQQQGEVNRRFEQLESGEAQGVAWGQVRKALLSQR